MGSKAMRIERYYTQPGASLYDLVAFTTTKSEIRSKLGLPQDATIALLMAGTATVRASAPTATANDLVPTNAPFIFVPLL